MQARYTLAQPENMSPLNFDPCDNMGGQAHREWTMLYKSGPVFIGFHNHKWTVLFSSKPDAKWKGGCQDSRAHGSPWPRSDEAHLIGFHEIPDEAKDAAHAAFMNAIEECRHIISKWQQRKLDDEKKTSALAEKKMRMEITAPWLNYAKGEEDEHR